MALTNNSFSKCSPSIDTNIAQCGTVTLCNARPLEADELTTTFQESGEYRVMNHLFQHDFEAKMCGVVQNGLYDFFMANKVNVSKKMQTDKLNSGLLRIRPFVLARQHSPVNNEFWIGSGGVDAGGGNWSIAATSPEGIPVDTRTFNVGDRVYIDGQTGGGTSTKTAWSVVSRTVAGAQINLVLSPQNSASSLPAARLTSPTAGLIFRGTNNVSDFEEWCNEGTAYMNWKNVPFWVETTRNSFCRSELYQEWRKLLLAENALYKEFGDLDEIEVNKQLALDFQKRFVNNIFFSKPLPNQTPNDFDSLTDINTAAVDGIDLGGARCVGKRANVVGIYEQLAACGRVHDSQGAQLNMPALFTALYTIRRVRQTMGVPADSIDIFTDSLTAERINQAMLLYYKDKGQDMLRITVDVKDSPIPVQKAEFGFSYRSYPLFYPQGMTINIVTHNFFDDYITAATAAGVGDVARVLWILELSTTYVGIVATNRVVNKTGDLKTLAAIDKSFACVMKVPTEEQTLNSVTYTVIVECPDASLIIDNFSSAVPEAVTETGAYPATTTTTTTTAA